MTHEIGAATLKSESICEYGVASIMIGVANRAYQKSCCSWRWNKQKDVSRLERGLG